MAAGESPTRGMGVASSDWSKTAMPVFRGMVERLRLKSLGKCCCGHKAGRVINRVVPLAPQLAVALSSLFAAMAQGGQTLVNFSVAKSGGATSGPVQVLLPSAPWLALVTPLTIPPLAPGRARKCSVEGIPVLELGRE